MSYTKALELGLVDKELLNRRNAIQEFHRFGTPLPPFTLEIKDCDLLEFANNLYETGAQFHAEIPALQLDLESETWSDKSTLEDPNNKWEDYESWIKRSVLDDLDNEWEGHGSGSEGSGSDDFGK